MRYFCTGCYSREVAKRQAVAGKTRAGAQVELNVPATNDLKLQVVGKGNI